MSRLLDGDIVITSDSERVLVIGPYSKYFSGVYAINCSGIYGLLTWGGMDESMFIPHVTDSDQPDMFQHDDLKGK